jgi:hypothetical protein
MRRSPAARALATVALAACAARPAAPPAAPLADPVREAAAVRDVAASFIAAEARGDEASDTLLAPGADFINGGIAVTARPRLAGVPGRGDATMEGLRTQLAGELAWVIAVYRWAVPGTASAERGRATMILERRDAGWRIRHVHSSTVAPWE